MGAHQKFNNRRFIQTGYSSTCKYEQRDRIAIRLRAIVAAKEHGIGMVSKIFDITTNTNSQI